MKPVVFRCDSLNSMPPDLKASWGPLLTAFIQDQDIMSGSREVYIRFLRKFLIWLADTGKLSQLETLSRMDILTYKEFLRESGLSSSTINYYLVLVRKFFTYLESKKIMPNVARGIKNLKKHKGFKKACFTAEQIKKVLSGIDTSTLQGKRDFALINLMVRTGIRCIEASRACIEDIRQEGTEAVLLVHGKGRDAKDDFVILVDESLKPLREYLALRKNKKLNQPLFAPLNTRHVNRPLTTRMISMICKESFRKAGLDSRLLTAHSLRHTSISLAINAGVPLHDAMAFARHTDPKTTLVYYHQKNRISDAAEKHIKITE